MLWGPIMRTFVIGRGKLTDIPVPSDESSVSRKHAEIMVTTDGRYFVCDLGSKGGTYVWEDNHWVPKSKAFVGPDTRLRLGEYETTVRQLLGSVDQGAELDLPGQRIARGDSGPPGGGVPGGAVEVKIAPSPTSDMPGPDVERNPTTGEIIKRGT